MYCVDGPLMFFYHFLEKHTPISNTNLIWTYDLDEVTKKSIIPLDGRDAKRKKKFKYKQAYGICSNSIGLYRSI